ncbi:MAG: endonuclease MutS2 [Bryobacteraceae bacterium]
MTNSSAELLEFDAVRALVERYVSSAAGHEALASVEPVCDRGALEDAHAETAEALAYQDSASRPQTAQRGAAVRLRFDSMPDVSEAVAKLTVGGVVLEGPEIRQLISLLDRASDIRAILSAASSRFPRLGARASAIAEFRPLLREVAGKIEPDGTVSDHASVALNRIRRDMERQQRMIQESLGRFLRAHRDDGVLQEEFVTIRSERFVLPVVAGKQTKIQGIIHAASGTGHTLFVEPFETVSLNNDLVRLREQEQREIFRILEEITGRFREAAGSIATTVDALGELEVVFAKARFAADFDCVIPVFSPADSPRLHVESARHPLLMDVLKRQNKAVVPLTLTLEGSSHTLLISGPNTGGKTVALKTIGVLALMAQSGLPVPAAKAELPLFDQVLADIGDHQSLEQSLSTFSAHIARIRQMLGDLTRESLVLLDELGRATDPDEGGALGVAIIDRIRRVGAFALASTHLVAPKVYAATTEGVVNASMSFDEETLAPTYVLRVGVPGASAGLDIAQRNGLPLDLIEYARAALSGNQRDLARLLKLLEQRLEAVTQREKELAATRTTLEAEQAQWKAAAEKREAAKIGELEKRTEALVREFESKARQTIDKLADSASQKKFTEQSVRKVAQASREMREEVEIALRTAPPAEAAPKLELKEGMRVRLRGVREPARIKRLIAADKIEVEAGFLKMQVGLEDVVEVLPDAPATGKLPKGVSFRGAPREAAPVAREINLIGRRADEAVEEVDKFLDNASLASVERVRIVHGHGMGILKRAIAEMLKGHPMVNRYFEAPQNEGGAGATIVELRVD